MEAAGPPQVQRGPPGRILGDLFEQQRFDFLMPRVRHCLNQRVDSLVENWDVLTVFSRSTRRRSRLPGLPQLKRLRLDLVRTVQYRGHVGSAHTV